MATQERSPVAPALAKVGRLRSRLASLDTWHEAWIISAGCIFLAAALVLLLILPGRTFSIRYVHDMMIFFDGAHRVLAGQLPNRDFHTPLGPLAYFFPAFGLWFGGTLGGMLPYATAGFTLLFLPLLIYVCVSRLPPGYATIFAVFALALVVGPASIGETQPSYGMFYNRWGYALLGLLFLLAAPQQRGHPRAWADAIVATAVLLLTFYLKISYFAVAAGFTAALLLFQHTRRLGACALVATAAAMTLIHFLWGSTATYLADISMAAKVTGAVRASALGLVHMTIESAAMILPFLLVMGLAIARRVSWATIFLCGLMAGAGLLLRNQNHQGPGMMTLVPAAILAGIALARARSDDKERKNGFALAAMLLVTTMALPPAALAIESIVVHTLMAARGGDLRQHVAEIDGFITQEVNRPPEGKAGLEKAREAYRVGYADLGTLNAIRTESLSGAIAQPEYFWSLEDGVQLLRREPGLSGKVFTLDMANPFNAFLARSAPRGIDSWYHAGRNFSEAEHRRADEIFADVDVIMVPKAPVQPASHMLLEQLYGSYIDSHYKMIETSDYWRAYTRKGPTRSE